MARLREFFGRGRPDNPDDSDTARRVQEGQPRPVNQGPQEPVLSDREVLEAEAKELFVSKEERPAVGSAQTRSVRETVPYTGNAEITSPPHLESAMTKARIDVLDILSRIEKAGISISPELKTQVKDELANLAAEAARVEFQEAERSNPLIELRRIFQEAIDGASQKNLRQTRDYLAAGLNSVDSQVEEFVREFQRRKFAVLQQGGDAANTESIVSNLLRMSDRFGFTARFLGQIAFYTSRQEQQQADEAIDRLLEELAVFSGGRPIALTDLIQAVQDSRRRNVDNGLPYIDRDDRNLVVGVTSSKQELSGLFLNILRQSGGFETQTSLNLFGDKNFWLRFAKNSPELK